MDAKGGPEETSAFVIFVVRMGCRCVCFFCGLEKEVDLCEDMNFGIGLLHKCCELWRSKTAKTEGDSSSVSRFFPES